MAWSRTLVLAVIILFTDFDLKTHFQCCTGNHKQALPFRGCLQCPICTFQTTETSCLAIGHMNIILFAANSNWKAADNSCLATLTARTLRVSGDTQPKANRRCRFHLLKLMKAPDLKLPEQTCQQGAVISQQRSNLTDCLAISLHDK